MGEALARAKPLADAESYYVTICFIGRSTIDLNDSSMERWEPWYKHLSTVTCEGAKYVPSASLLIDTSISL